MKRDKQEQFKTLILFLILFFGINYALYEYIIVPKIAQIDELKVSYLESTQSQTLMMEKEDEKLEIEKALIDAESISDTYDNLVLDKIDTIQMAYDVYAFSKQRGISTQIIRFNLADVDEGKRAFLEEEAKQKQLQEEQDLLGPNTDPTLAVIPIESEEKTPTYRKAIIEIEVIVQKNQLEEYLKEISLLSTQSMSLNSMTISAEIESSDNLNSDNEQDTKADMTIDTTTDTIEKVTDNTDDNQIIETGPDIIRLNLSFTSYIKSTGVLIGERVEYTFKNDIETQKVMEELFSSHVGQ